jgi:hypothetical protein
LGCDIRKSAYAGIAASLIGGSTLHQLALLHKMSKMSRKTIDALKKNWGPVTYLIIDEVSMISKKTLADISEMVGIGKQHEGDNNSTVPFGGIHVIIAGDFHQFPPVVGIGKGKGALYTPSPPLHGIKSVLGRTIYEQFREVVILKQQFRIQDEVWQGVLHRARYGKCTAEDLKEIRSLILDPIKDKDLVCASDSEWADVILVTPRHAVRNKWNELAARYHCQQKRQVLVESNAYNTYKGKPLDRKLQSLVRSRTFSTADGGASANARGDPGGLPDIVQLAIGMQVMITNNIETELDVANGARGTVEKIIVAPDSATELSNHIQTLTRPPCCVLVRLSRTKAKALPGLDAGIIPITPIRNSFKIKLPDGKNVNLWREQLPLTPAYAFTDYRARGQTIPHVIIDLATPPSGGLTPFNAYVALSRSRTRRHARLLRDFEDKLFQTPPNEYLVVEDARLEHLNRLSQQSMYT